MRPGIRSSLASLLFAGILVAPSVSAQSAFARSVAMSDSADVIYFSSVYPLRDQFRRVLRWDGDTDKLTAVANDAYDLLTSADGRTLAFADRNGVWAVPPNGRVLPFPSGPGVPQFALHSSGKYLCSTVGSQGAFVWSLAADDRWSSGQNMSCKAFLDGERVLMEDRADPRNSKLVIWSFLTHTFEPVDVDYPLGSELLGLSRNGEYRIVASPSSLFGCFRSRNEVNSFCRDFSGFERSHKEISVFALWSEE